MDHAWYERDVDELLGWRSIAVGVWSSAFAFVAALLAATARATSQISRLAPLVALDAWIPRVAFALLYALTTLPCVATTTRSLRPSPAPLRLTSRRAQRGGCDPWLVFSRAREGASPGTIDDDDDAAAYVASRRAPSHLFPPGWASSRWVRAQHAGETASERARATAETATLLLAHVASCAAGCVAFASFASRAAAAGSEHMTATDPGATDPIRAAATHGCVLGVVLFGDHLASDASDASYPPGAARSRWLRARRSLPRAVADAAKLAAIACVVRALVETTTHENGSLTSGGVVGFALGVVTLVGALATELVASFASPSALAGVVVASSVTFARAMARVVHTEPYAFLPQTLERGAVVASAPLLASLTRADKPFAQHAAYRDLCDVAETGGGGRRRLLLGDDGSGGGEYEYDGRYESSRRGRIAAGAEDGAYAPALAAALAPVLSVVAAIRAALDAAEKASEGSHSTGRLRAGGGGLGSGGVGLGGVGGGFFLPSDRRRDAGRNAGVRLRTGGPAGVRVRENGGGGGGGGGGLGDARRDGGKGSSSSYSSSSSSPRTMETRAMARSSHQGQKTSSREPFRDVGVGAGDRANAAAWSMLADDWGMPMDAVAPLPKPSPAPLAGDVAGIDGGPGWGFFGMNGSHGMNGDGRARANAGDDVGFLNNFFARNDDASAALRRQMDSVGVACADARASLAAHGQLAAWGARAAAALACSPEGMEIERAASSAAAGRRRMPDAGAAFRVLLAATHACKECARAGTSVAPGVGARATSKPPRVPGLRDAARAAAALADVFQTTLFAFVDAYGADRAREMLNPPFSDEETRAFEAAATGAGGEASALEADIAAGRRAPKELERLLGEIARWE